jgi:acylphosphatase
MCFQGEIGAVDEMEDWCRIGSPYARITGISVSAEPVVEHERGFEIR